MRHIPTISLRLVVLAGLLASLVQAAESDPEYRWRILANIGADTVNLTLTRHDGFNTISQTNSVPLSSLRGLERSDMYGGPASFHIRRDAGTLYCKGSFALGVGWGSVTFHPDPRFLSELKEIGFRDVREDQLFDLAIDNFRLSTARELRAACKCVQTVDDVIELNNHGVDGYYLGRVTRLSSHPLSIEAITQMKDHGVQISLLEALQSAGYQLPAESVTELQDHGVGASLIREMGPRLNGAGNAQDLIELHDHGVSPEFVRHLEEAGVNPSIDEIIQLHDHGTDADLVSAAKGAGMDKPVSSAIALQDHGIDTQYVRNMSQSLRARISADELIQLHDQGISPEFAERVAQSGFKAAGPEQLISLHEHGVPAELLTQAGRSHRVSFTTDEIIRLHEQGVDAEFLHSFDAAGYENASAADLIELHEHGVTADFARRLQSEGYGSLSVSQLVKMKDHGM
ncbi:MAG: hypothetical protein JO138_22555 [Acidobacteriaceae bacterium]|nr:hypothetical protein [Acidobacteriaceae bacterium]